MKAKALGFFALSSIESSPSPLYRCRSRCCCASSEGRLHVGQALGFFSLSFFFGLILCNQHEMMCPLARSRCLCWNLDVSICCKFIYNISMSAQCKRSVINACPWDGEKKGKIMCQCQLNVGILSLAPVLAAACKNTTISSSLKD